MLGTTGASKEEACKQLDDFLEIGAEGITRLRKCEGDFPRAYNNAKAFCSGDTGGAAVSITTAKRTSGTGMLCDIAKMHVRLYLSA